MPSRDLNQRRCVMRVECWQCGSELEARVRDRIIEVKPCESCLEDAEDSVRNAVADRREKTDLWCKTCGDDLRAEEHSDEKGWTINVCERCAAAIQRKGELGALEMLG
jgi:hypothetical protein